MKVVVVMVRVSNSLLGVTLVTGGSGGDDGLLKVVVVVVLGVVKD